MFFPFENKNFFYNSSLKLAVTWAVKGLNNLMLLKGNNMNKRYYGKHFCWLFSSCAQTYTPHHWLNEMHVVAQSQIRSAISPRADDDSSMSRERKLLVCFFLIFLRNPEPKTYGFEILRIHVSENISKKYIEFLIRDY